MRVKCYGGPCHGREENIPEGAHRFEVRLRLGPPPFMHSIEDFLAAYAPQLDCDTCTYFVYPYYQRGITEARSIVERQMEVAVLDGCDLTTREWYEIERDIERSPWKWPNKPNFLTQFDQWFEYTLNEIGWEKPTVRYL